MTRPSRIQIFPWLALPLISTLFLAGCTSPVELSTDQEWYVFAPSNTYPEQSLIGLEDWNSEPAGTHGRIPFYREFGEFDGAVDKTPFYLLRK